MSLGRFGPGIEDHFGVAFAAEIEKIAKEGRSKKGSKNRLLRILTGSGIGGILGSSLVAGSHGLVHAKRMKTYRSLRPLAEAFGPEIGRAYARYLKPRYFKPELLRKALAGGLLGAVPGAAIGALV